MAQGTITGLFYAGPVHHLIDLFLKSPHSWVLNGTGHCELMESGPACPHSSRDLSSVRPDLPSSPRLLSAILTRGPQAPAGGRHALWQQPEGGTRRRAPCPPCPSDCLPGAARALVLVLQVAGNSPREKFPHGPQLLHPAFGIDPTLPSVTLGSLKVCWNSLYYMCLPQGSLYINKHCAHFSSIKNWNSAGLGGLVVKNSPCNAGDMGWILCSGRSRMPRGN